MFSLKNTMRALGETEDRLRSWCDAFTGLVTSIDNAATEVSGEEISSVRDAIEQSRSGLHVHSEPAQVAESGTAARRAVTNLVSGLVEARNTREKEFKRIIWITAEAGAAMVRSGSSHADEIRQFASQIEATSCLESVVEIRRQMTKRLDELNGVARRIQEDSEKNAAALTREIQRVQERLKAAETLAETDALTKLGNRRLLERNITASIEAQEKFCLVVLDLDGFKEVNDRFGHAEGDRLLQSVATALSAAVRGTDAVGRWGGDEFVIVLRDIDLAEAETRVAQIQKKAFGEFMVGEDGHAQRLNVSACFGIAECRPGESPDDLFERADGHLYQLKKAMKEPKPRNSGMPPMPVLAQARR